MTQIRYSVNGLYLHVKDHAGGGAAGTDIICAGISSLTCALINMLNEEQDKGHIQALWTMETEPPEVTIRAHPIAEHYRRTARDYYRLTVMGLKAIAENYPENIKMEEVQDSGGI